MKTTVMNPVKAFILFALGLAIALLIKGGGALSVDRALTREGRGTVAMPAPRM